MGFITVTLERGGAVLPVQLSDSNRSLKRIAAVLSIALKQSATESIEMIEYRDDEGDWVGLYADADVDEMFAVGKAAAPRALPVCRPNLCI